MKELILYVHGKGGSAEEAGHYRPLFPNSAVVGFDYQAQTPWEAKEEFPRLFARQKGNAARRPDFFCRKQACTPAQTLTFFVILGIIDVKSAIERDGYTVL